MASPLSLEGYTLLKMLIDGEWRDYEEVVDALAATVAPGRAIRTYRSREAARQRVTPRVGPPLTDDKQQASGARVLALAAIKGLRRNWLEVQEADPEAGTPKRVRRLRQPGRRAVDIPPELEMKPVDGSESVERERPAELPLGDVSEPADEQQPEAAFPVEEFEALIARAVRLGIAQPESREVVAEAVRTAVHEEFVLFSDAFMKYLADHLGQLERVLVTRLGSTVRDEIRRGRSPLGLPETRPDRPWNNGRKK